MIHAPRLQKRSFSLSGHRTSVALEPEFWLQLERMAIAESRTLAGLIAHIDSCREQREALASSLRVAALRFALTSNQRICGDLVAR